MAEDSIASTYQEIFDADPLLIREESQERYSRAMLDHLLVKRTMKICDPRLLDLHKPEMRQVFKRSAAAQIGPPPDDVGTRYRAARANREAVSKEDFAILRHITMVSNGELTKERRQGGELAGHDEASARLAEAGAESRIERRFKIAAIGYRIGVSRLAGQGHLGEELCMYDPPPAEGLVAHPERAGLTQLGRTYAHSPDRVRQWETAILKHVECALERDCQLIVLPEFTLPSACPGLPPIDEQISDLMARYDGDRFVFAGSRHEGTTNRGLVFYKRKGKATSKRWWHYKVASARGLGENILGAFGTKMPTYLATYDVPGAGERVFAIAVAICYDAFDPTMFLNLIVQGIRNYQITEHSIVLVPSFNPSQDFVALLRDLSFIARCTVIYVDSLHGNAEMFIAGFAVADLVAKVDDIDEYLRLAIDSLERSMRRERESIRHEVSKPDPQPLGRSQTSRYNLDAMRHRRSILTVLRQQFQSLLDSGAFEGMVTVERRESEATTRATAGAYCETDALYYNIDLMLIGALLDFRDNFFKNDPFLPRPFSLSELQKAVKWMDEAQLR